MISNFQDFLSVIKRCFIFMIAMSAKAVLPGLLKIKAFWNKVYAVILSVFQATNKTWSCDTDYFLDLVMWSNLVPRVFLWEKLWLLQFSKYLTRKTNNFFERWSWFKFNNLGLALDMTFKFYYSVEKKLKRKFRRKSQKLLRANSKFWKI